MERFAAVLHAPVSGLGRLRYGAQLPDLSPQLATPAQKGRTAPYRVAVLFFETRGFVAYAISGKLFIVGSCGICFFSQTFALHRPTNGAVAIIPNATPNAICINISFFSPKALLNLPGVEPGSDLQTCKELHVATVDSPLSPRRTSLDIPPLCYRLVLCVRTAEMSVTPGNLALTQRNRLK